MVWLQTPHLLYMIQLGHDAPNCYWIFWIRWTSVLVMSHIPKRWDFDVYLCVLLPNIYGNITLYIERNFVYIFLAVVIYNFSLSPLPICFIPSTQSALMSRGRIWLQLICLAHSATLTAMAKLFDQKTLKPLETQSQPIDSADPSTQPDSDRTQQINNSNLRFISNTPYQPHISSRDVLTSTLWTIVAFFSMIQTNHFLFSLRDSWKYSLAIHSGACASGADVFDILLRRYRTEGYQMDSAGRGEVHQWGLFLQCVTSFHDS